MSIYVKIINDHELAKKIYEQISTLAEDNIEKLKELFKRLKNELTLHNKAEEKVFYAHLRNHPKTKDIIPHSIEEHEVVEALFEELESLSFDHPEWMDKLEMAMNDVMHHMEEEENKIFNLAKEIISKDEEKKLGEGMDKAKKEIKEEMKAT